MSVYDLQNWTAGASLILNGQQIAYTLKDLQTDLSDPKAAQPLAPSFGPNNVLNYASFDIDLDGTSDYTFLKKYAPNKGPYSAGVPAAALLAKNGFVQVKSNFSGFNSFVAEKSSGVLSYDSKASGTLFDFYHIDGLSDSDYVTAQITSASAPGIHLSVYGETDAFQTESYNAKTMSWPYLQHDILVIDTSETGNANQSLGDVAYTLQVVTDWSGVKKTSQYNAFDWAFFDFTPNEQLYDDLNWGKVQFNEFNDETWSEVDFSLVDGNELDKSDIKNIVQDEAIINGDSKSDLDVTVLKKSSKSFVGGDTCDMIIADTKAKGVQVAGGADSDKFVLKKGKGDIIITDYEPGLDQINTSFVKGKIKLQKKGNDTQIFAGKDLLATVQNIEPGKLKKKAKGFV